MSLIWKFVLATEHEQSVSMPKDARLLSFANQSEAPCLWAMVDPDAPTAVRRLLMAGTGHSVPDNGRFVGTALMSGGALVLHLFDGGEDS